MDLKLPLLIASKRDVIKTQREIEKLLDERLQHDIAQEKTGNLRHLSNPSRAVTQLMEYNDLETNSDDMKSMLERLEQVRQSGHQIRISFASEPSHEVYEKIIGWFRHEIRQDVLVQIGVQPGIAGGCVVQTGPRRYDFSLRQHLISSVPKFRELIHAGVIAAEPAPQPVQEPAA